MTDRQRLYYTPRGVEIDLDKVEQWASIGMTIENMAALCGIGRRTLYDFREENAQFAHDFDLAIESGKAQGVEAVANKLIELCLEGHPASIQYFLERKGGFQKTENLNQNVTGELAVTQITRRIIKPKPDADGTGD